MTTVNFLPARLSRCPTNAPAARALGRGVAHPASALTLLTEENPCSTVGERKAHGFVTELVLETVKRANIPMRWRCCPGTAPTAHAVQRDTCLSATAPSTIARSFRLGRALCQQRVASTAWAISAQRSAPLSDLKPYRIGEAVNDKVDYLKEGGVITSGLSPTTAKTRCAGLKDDPNRSTRSRYMVPRDRAARRSATSSSCRVVRVSPCTWPAACTRPARSR
jgi:hypothetical protein